MATPLAPPAADADAGESLPPDRSLELTDKSYHMAEYTWFRIRGRLSEMPAPHYLGHGFAYSPSYNIRSVRQAPMADHVVVKIALSAGGVTALKPGLQLRRVRPGEAILRFVQEPEFWEAYDGRQKKPWEFLGLILRGDVAVATARGLIDRFGRTYDLGVNHRLVQRLLAMAVGDSHVTEMTGLEAYHLSNGLFQALYEAADDNCGRARHVELAEAADSLIRERYAYDWSVARVARHLGVSREHLTRAFKDRHGVPPHRFMIELRIQEACRRLKSTSDSVKKIFLELGFKSHTSFSRTFQRYHRVTPSEYREQRS